MSISLDRSVGSRAAATALRLSSGAYIASPAYDWIFFILAPLWALLVGIAVRALALDQYRLIREDDGGKLLRLGCFRLGVRRRERAHRLVGRLPLEPSYVRAGKNLRSACGQPKPFS